MPTNSSQQKLELLVKVASTRLDIVNEADNLARLGQEQLNLVNRLKKKAVTYPVYSTSIALLGSAAVGWMIYGSRKKKKAHLQSAKESEPNGMSRFIVKTILTLAFPTLKKYGFQLIRTVFSSIVKR